MMITPCKDCPARHLVCHDSRLKYAEFKRQRGAEAAYTREMLDTGKVYHYLGNGIQHDLCLRFVASSYDLEIIREEERKQ